MTRLLVTVLAGTWADGIPLVPTSVWDQIPVIIVFAFLLAGLGWVFSKVLTKSVEDINANYSRMIENNNIQWQRYFDARSESSKLVNDSIIEELAKLATVIAKMDANFTAHDQMERQALAEMSKRRQPRLK